MTGNLVSAEVGVWVGGWVFALVSLHVSVALSCIFGSKIPST